MASIKFHRGNDAYKKGHIIQVLERRKLFSENIRHLSGSSGFSSVDTGHTRQNIHMQGVGCVLLTPDGVGI